METQYVEVARTGITDRYAVKGLDDASWNIFFDSIIMPLIDGGAEVIPLSESEFLGHPAYKHHIFFDVDEVGRVVHYMTEWESKPEMEEWIKEAADFQRLHGTSSGL